MKLMVPLIEKSCDALMGKLAKIADSDQSVDMLDWFSKLTLEVILATASGVDTNVQMGENTDMLEKAKALFHIPFIVTQIARLPVVMYYTLRQKIFCLRDLVHNYYQHWIPKTEAKSETKTEAKSEKLNLKN
ncbi:hypothetical protein ACROYT_G026051 [Oculina patagonica]